MVGRGVPSAPAEGDSRASPGPGLAGGRGEQAGGRALGAGGRQCWA